MLRQKGEFFCGAAEIFGIFAEKLSAFFKKNAAFRQI
jgi:hypothetical protein